MKKISIVLLALAAISTTAFANNSRDVRTIAEYTGPYPELSGDNLNVLVTPKISQVMSFKHSGLSTQAEKEINRLDEKNGDRS